MLQEMVRQAVSHLREGEVAKAEVLLRRTLTAAPDHPVALHMLGVAAIQKGDLKEASRLISKALRARPDYPEAHNNLGMVLLRSGRETDAFTAFVNAVVLQPNAGPFWANFGECLAGIHFTTVPPPLFDVLLAALDRPSIHPASVARAVANALRRHPHVEPLLAGKGEVDAVAAAERLSAVPLLLRLMALAPIPDPDLEEWSLRVLDAKTLEEVFH
ncbi:MAG: tetratricopeptide repeat protein [Magnetospirillum sp. WYHS-4]